MTPKQKFFSILWLMFAFCFSSALFWTALLLRADIELNQLAPPLMFYGAGIWLAIAQLANIVLSDVPLKDKTSAQRRPGRLVTALRHKGVW